jgi:hypothetical protein
MQRTFPTPRLFSTSIIIIALAAAGPAAGKDLKRYVQKNGKTANIGGKPRVLLHVDPLEGIGDYARNVAPSTIAIRVDTSTPSVPHTSVRIGRREYDIMSSRRAGRKTTGRPSLNEDFVGAMYKVPKIAIEKLQRYFDDRVTAINKFNLQPFHFSAFQPAILKPGAKSGTWEIVNTRRAPSSRVVEGKLVQDGRQYYLESPNLAAQGEKPRRMRFPVRKTGGTLELEQITCASFVFSGLQAVAEANPELNLPRFHQIHKSAKFAARKIGAELQGQSPLAKNRYQDMTALYRDGPSPRDLQQAILQLTSQ